MSDIRISHETGEYCFGTLTQGISIIVLCLKSMILRKKYYYLCLYNNNILKLMKKLVYLLPLLLFIACANKQHDYITMVVGTYTDTDSQGIYSFAFDQNTGKVMPLDTLDAVNPSFLIFSADSSLIYSVNELEDNRAAVSAISFDKKTGRLNLIDTQPTLGGAPCYLATNGNTLVTANYTGGSLTVFPLENNGKVLPADTVYYGSTGGPDLSRQEQPHVHCVEFTPDGKFLIATDFSADRLLVFEVSQDKDSINPLLDDAGQQIYVELEPDYGPRHIIFDNRGKYAYVVGELSGKVIVLELFPDGSMKTIQVIEGDPYKGRGSADIHLSPDGKYLYTTNRLEGDGISMFSVDPETGTLSPVGYKLTGKHPRNFAITPNGLYVLVACRDTDAIEVYERNPTTGLIEDQVAMLPVPKPVCIKFF